MEQRVNRLETIKLQETHMNEREKEKGGILNRNLSDVFKYITLSWFIFILNLTKPRVTWGKENLVEKVSRSH